MPRRRRSIAKTFVAFPRTAGPCSASGRRSAGKASRRTAATDALSQSLAQYRRDADGLAVLANEKGRQGYGSPA